MYIVNYTHHTHHISLPLLHEWIQCEFEKVSQSKKKNNFCLV